MILINSILFFSEAKKVYTKVKNKEATYYSENSRVENSQFASGSIINGSVLHSIVSRNCLVDDGSVVKDSILFPKVKIGKNVNIEYAIIDKSAEIADNVTIKGTPEKPVIIGKSDKITEDVKG